MVLLVVLQLMVLQNSQAQTIKEQFPNLFRGGRRQEQDKNTNIDSSTHLLAIRPIGNERSTNSGRSSGTHASYQQAGLIRMSPNVWNQAEIEVELFQSSRYKFRQSPMDQPKPNLFYGNLMMDDDNDTTVDSGNSNGDDDNDMPGSRISLMQTTVTPSNIPVVTGSIHVQGTLYQIRQLPSGDLVLDQRGSFDDFDEEVEIEDDGNMDIGGNRSDWEALAAAALANNGLANSGRATDALEVDFPLDRRRRRRHLEGSSRNASTADTNHRALQNGDDGSQLDILVSETSGVTQQS